ncbi:hypothetical protein M0651_17570 [Paenibacillus sp. MBLB2552]|uniref:Uncharacterized protein n=1 Tax=Paenibacillus mellifer TaxID=2937794 RepID=A0A9X1Y1S2_9BACL|nr:hypothetical protein [Paenibacillus mellifer]MCK8488983.1 hypothetical protein [Paenibacillus mellifer]
MQAAQQRQQPPARGGVEAGRRLVEHEQRRLQRQHRCNCGALPSAAGQRVHGCMATGRHRHRRQRIRYPPFQLGGGHTQVLRAEGDFVFDPALHELCVGVLEHDPDAPGHLADLRFRGIDAVHEHSARAAPSPGSGEIPAD